MNSRQLFLSYLLLTLLGIGSFARPTIAQAANCQPPNPGEYLLLVVSETAESQNQVKRTVPPSVNTTVCRYLDSLVTRVDGFTTLEVVNSWARYMTEIEGLPAFVAQPPQAITPQPTATPINSTIAPSPSPTPVATQPIATVSPTHSSTATPVTATINPIAYNPQLLGQGYAVLVDYQQNPDLAAQLKRLLGRDVGLVSYRQRPYLLANYTPQQGTANATLKAISDRGFIGLIVDSRRVVVLSKVVRY